MSRHPPDHRRVDSRVGIEKELANDDIGPPRHPKQP